MSHTIGSTRSRRGVALVLALGIGTLGACSDDGGSESAATGSSSAETSESTSSSSAPSTSSAPAAEEEAEAVTVSAVDFDFELSEDSYSAGTYTFEVTNGGQMPHNFAVERDGETVGATDVLQPGGTETIEVTLEAGDYVFYCSVGQHRANGMEVPVTVSA